ncbi:MAG: MorD protein [Deltaproteobacteria bacterium]|nr:MorD protein [Deltaproteobacteria bacterium]
MPRRVAVDPVGLSRIIELLAPALSKGRRRSAQLVTGSERAFFVSKTCTQTFVPYPLIGEEPSLRTVTCGIALQASPSKEEIASLPLHQLRPVERAALTLVEGEVAMAWAIENWPGLESDLRRRLPGLRLRDAKLSGKAMLKQALRLSVDRRDGLLVPDLLGRLPGDERSRRPLADFFRGRGRMPYALRKSQSLRPPLFAIPVAGGGGVRSRNIPPPPGVDDDPETRSERRVGIPYDEWNVHTKNYRRGHVSVLERHAPMDSGPPLAALPEVLRWFRHGPTRTWQRGLEDGTDVDIEAYVEQHCATVSGGVSDGRIYRAMDKGSRDVATAVLLDGSASSGTDGGMHLRLQLACADALTSALVQAREPHGVFAFTGNTRHRVEVRVLKDFNEPHATLPGRTGIETAGYTRLGAPLRHLTRRLLAVPAERRILLSLGDGLPSDEGYEGHYAWADVARAVEEADDAGVFVYHIGIGRVRADPLRDCFGSRRSRRVSSVADLPRVLAEVHEGLCES